MKKFILITTMVALNTGALVAQDASLEKSILSLTEPAAVATAESIARKLNVTDQALIAECIEEIHTSIQKNMEALTASHLKLFTPEELKEVANFLESEVGKKYVSGSIKMTEDADYVAALQPIYMEFVQKLQGAVTPQAATAPTAEPSKAITPITTKAELDALTKENDLVVVKFYAVWCGPCKQLDGLYNELTEENASIKFVSVNIDNAQALAQEYKVQGVPAIKFIKAGKVVDEVVGYNPEAIKKSVAQLK